MYGTTTGNAKLFADDLARRAIQLGHSAQVTSLQTYDPELLEVETARHVLVFIVSTYTDGTPPERCVQRCGCTRNR
jgi:sulfite reductase alpha subunit-like flavoprotein